MRNLSRVTDSGSMLNSISKRMTVVAGALALLVVRPVVERRNRRKPRPPRPRNRPPRRLALVAPNLPLKTSLQCWSPEAQLSSSRMAR